MKSSMILIGAIGLSAIATGLRAENAPKPFAELVPSDKENQFASLAFSPDAKTLGTAWATVTFWDIATGRRAHSLTGAFPIAWSPRGGLVAVANIYEGPHRVDLVSSTTLKPVLSLSRKDLLNRPEGMAFSPDGKSLACYYDNGAEAELILWDVATGKSLATVSKTTSRSLLAIAYSRDGQFLTAVTARYGSPLSITVWDAQSYKPRWSHTLKVGGARTAAISPNGLVVAVGADSRSPGKGDRPPLGVGTLRVRLWDAQTAREVAILTQDSEGEIPVAFSPDGKLIATGGFGTFKLWDAATHRLRAEYTVTDESRKDWPAPSCRQVLFSPDSQILAIEVRFKLRLWLVSSLLERNQ